MIEWTITVGNLLTAAAMVAAALGAFFFQRWQIDYLTARDVAREKDTRRLADEFTAFRLHVTEHFVQHPNLEKVEQRLLTAIEQLTGQIAKLNDRLPSPRSRRGTGE